MARDPDRKRQARTTLHTIINKCEAWQDKYQQEFAPKGDMPQAVELLRGLLADVEGA
jgi:hypothetical protein